MALSKLVAGAIDKRLGELRALARHGPAIRVYAAREVVIIRDMLIG